MYLYQCRFVLPNKIDVTNKLHGRGGEGFTLAPIGICVMFYFALNFKSPKLNLSAPHGNVNGLCVEQQTKEISVYS